jgi:hypothetical protein
VLLFVEINSPRAATQQSVTKAERDALAFLQTVLKRPIYRTDMSSGFTYCSNMYYSHSWADDLDRRVSYTLFVSRYNPYKDYSPNSVVIYVNEQIPFDPVKDNDSVQIGKILEYINNLTTLDGLRLKNSQAHEISLIQLPDLVKGKVQYPENRTVLAKAREFKEYGKPANPLLGRSNWYNIGSATGQFDLCSSAEVSARRLFFDYNNDGIFEKNVSIKKTGHRLDVNTSAIVDDLYLGQPGSSEEELKRAKRINYVSEGSGATYLSGKRLVYGNDGDLYCNHKMQFESPHYSVKVYSGSHLAIEISRGKND